MSLFWIAIAGLVLAGVTEAVQNLPIIHREGEINDAMADFVGVLLGFPLHMWIENLLGKWSASRSKAGVAGETEHVT